jgi:hypothetical protein
MMIVTHLARCFQDKTTEKNSKLNGFNAGFDAAWRDVIATCNGSVRMNPWVD